MEQDIVVRLTRIINYPWVSRMDRSIYQQYPQLDPVRMGRWALGAGVVGYWLAKLKRWNRAMMTVGFVVPFVIKFLVDQWKLTDKVPAAGQLDFKKYPKLEWHTSSSPQSQLVSEQQRHPFRTKRTLPHFQSKILTPKDLISQLPPTYFK